MESAMTAILRDASGKMHHGILFGRRLGVGGTSYDGQNGEVPPERSIFFRLQVYERVGI